MQIIKIVYKFDTKLFNICNIKVGREEKDKKCSRYHNWTLPMAESSTDAQQQVETTDWIDQFCSVGSPRLIIQSSWSSCISNAIMLILIHRVVQSVVNLIEQTQGTDLSYFSALQTTLSRKLKWDSSADDIYTGAKYSRLDKIYELKQLLSTCGQSNNFLAKSITPRILVAFDTTSCEWVSNVTLQSTPRKIA